MAAHWEDFENRVRALAQHIWGAPCDPLRVGGVNVDGAVKVDQEIINLLEITENCTLQKVRDDVTKLQVAKSAAFSQGILARCFCVINGRVTQAMKDAADPHHIKVLSGDDFGKIFFDFDAYKTARVLNTFGSLVNPLTGKADNTKYIPVRYTVEKTNKEVSASDICDFLRQKRTVVLLGEYGTGKSRCVREIFDILSKDAQSRFTYPIAIDLRKSWGLERGDELVSRHFGKLGLEATGQNAIRAIPSGSIAFLLDGFDEIGSQAWSSDSQKLKLIRAKALEGVKDLVQNSPGGKLISGREHYFTSNIEMFSAIGIDPKDPIVLRVKNEFSDTELLSYFDERNIEIDLPEWLPRRPLICQTIASLGENDFSRMFGEAGDEVAFWGHFIDVICERDARIHVSFDANSIYRLFLRLSRLTRTKSANVGPISLTEMQEAFEEAVGSQPDENASVMLQRLPSLGRIGAESNDRQFVDTYILGGLRARDLIEIAVGNEDSIREVASQPWINPLDDLGQRIAARDKSSSPSALLRIAKVGADGKNKVLGSDAIASLMLGTKPVDYGGIEISQGSFLQLDFTQNAIANLTIKDSYAAEVYLPEKAVTNVRCAGCISPRVFGISSPQALPKWISKLDAEAFDSVASQSRIRRIGLDTNHEMLITFVRKTFFQKGSGRKEEALLRGFGHVASKALAHRILAVMQREGLLTTFKGREGTVYAPERSQIARMQKLLDELAGSLDPLWAEVGKL
jgi:hypothetical protein